MPAGDALVDSWFRGIYVPQAWCVSLATELDFAKKKKSCLFWVDRSPILLLVFYSATLLWRKGKEDYFSPKVRVRFKDNTNSPHGKFHRFLFPFSSKFFRPKFRLICSLYLPMSCHVTHSEPVYYNTYCVNTSFYIEL